MAVFLFPRTMKYARLSKEQLEEMHEEFAQFLAAQEITKDDWDKIKAENTDQVDLQLDAFSHLVWDNVLDKVKFLELISPNHMYLFKIDAALHLIGVKINQPLIDITIPEGYAWLKENLMNDAVELFQSKKEISDNLKADLFKLIQQGASITSGVLYGYFEDLISPKS